MGAYSKRLLLWFCISLLILVLVGVMVSCDAVAGSSSGDGGGTGGGTIGHWRVLVISLLRIIMWVTIAII